MPMFRLHGGPWRGAKISRGQKNELWEKAYQLGEGWEGGAIRNSCVGTAFPGQKFFHGEKINDGNGNGREVETESSGKVMGD